MELTLNLAWVALAVMMLWLWLRFAPAQGSARRRQVIALALAIGILLPVISVTDDLMLAQNLADTDRCSRKSLVSGSHDFDLHAFVELFSAAHDILVSDLESPTLVSEAALPATLASFAPIQKRPPPFV